MTQRLTTLLKLPVRLGSAQLHPNIIVTKVEFQVRIEDIVLTRNVRNCSEKIGKGLRWDFWSLARNNDTHLINFPISLFSQSVCYALHQFRLHRP